MDNVELIGFKFLIAFFRIGSILVRRLGGIGGLEDKGFVEVWCGFVVEVEFLSRGTYTAGVAFTFFKDAAGKLELFVARPEVGTENSADTGLLNLRLHFEA